MITIDNPEEAIILLDGLVATSHAQFQMKTDLLAKMHRAILQEQYRYVWRTIEGYPDYEMCGVGFIRFRKTLVYLAIEQMSGEPTLVSLDDETGYARRVFWHDIYMATFPELEVTR